MSVSNHQVVVFIAEWCPHCKQMKDNVWTDNTVVKSVKRFHGGKPAFVVCSRPQNRYLVDEFEIEKYPTVVIMDEDHNIKKRANNMNSSDLVEFLDEFNG
tara:strand:- start:4795 stop:5094 length:300 start_codon:yes stop_codon:yes gene_type:complete